MPGYVLARMSKGLSAWTKGIFGGNDNPTIEGRGLGSVPIPLGRMENGNNMGGACVYLSSRTRLYIKGSILPVDG